MTLYNEDQTNEAIETMGETIQNPFLISENDSKNFLEEFARVVALSINHGRMAFTNLKKLVDNYERDHREADKCHRPSFKQRYKTPAQWSSLEAWYEKYGKNSVGTNLSSSAIEGFVFTLFAEKTAELIVIEGCLKEKDGKIDHLTNEDGQNRLNIYGEIIGEDGHGVPFIKVANGKVSSLFSDEVKIAFKIAYKNSPTRVPNIEKLEEQYKSKALEAKTPEDKEFWSHLGIDTIRVLAETGNKEALKAKKIMEESLCQLKLGDADEMVQRYLYRVRSKHNAPFTHAQEAIEGLQDLYKDNFDTTWKPMMNACLNMVLKEAEHSSTRFDKYYGSEVRQAIASGVNYDTKECNWGFSICLGSMNFEGSTEGTNKNRYNLDTIGSFSSSNAKTEQTFDLVNKSINGQSFCKSQKDLETQVSLHPDSRRNILKELGRRVGNFTLIVNNLYEGNNPDSVLEKVDKVVESIEKHGGTEHPIKIRDLNSQNWFLTEIYEILNVAHSQGELDLSSAVSTKKALDSLLTKIGDEKKGVIPKFEDLGDVNLTNFIKTGTPVGKREELASSPKRFRKIREDGDSAYGLGTIFWIKVLWYVVWKFYIPEIKKELNADSKNQVHAQEICNKILKHEHIRFNAEGFASFAFLTDKNDIKIVEISRDMLKNISLSLLGLNVEHNVPRKYLDFHPTKNPPRLGDAKANNTDNQSYRDAYANVYLRHQAIEAKEIDPYQKQELLMNDRIRFEAELGHLEIDYDTVIKHGRDINPKCERTNDKVDANNAETIFEKITLMMWK